MLKIVNDGVGSAAHPCGKDSQFPLDSFSLRHSPMGLWCRHMCRRSCWQWLSDERMSNVSLRSPCVRTWHHPVSSMLKKGSGGRSLTGDPCPHPSCAWCQSTSSQLGEQWGATPATGGRAPP